MLAAAAVLVAGAGVGAAEKTWYVDDGGGEGIDYMKIQDAVNAAEDGDTIIVYGGTYKEAIVVDERLILRGLDHPVVDGDGSGSTITISADGCVIDGFKVTGSGLDWGEAGIRIISENNEIISNTISNNNNGIFFEEPYGGGHLPNNNTITNNIVWYNNAKGIYVYRSHYNIITNNTVNSNTDVGIKLGHSSHNLLTNNVVCSNNEEGIDLDDSSNNNNITNNIVTLNNEDGIDLDDSDYNTITDNNVSVNDGDGIDLNNSNNNIIANNIISNNDDGIDLENSSNNIISHNIIFFSDCDGIELEDSSQHNSITDNIIYSNGDAGISIESSGNNRIYHNNLIDNDEHASDDCSDNLWDMGQTVGGNYWSDHTCTGNPSDGSQPYYIDVDSIDHYPFADPIGELPPLTPPVPRTNVDVIKVEQLSTSDTYIDHNQQYNFDIEWSAGVWDLKNLDNVTITITTPIDLTYRHTWALYDNGSEICSVSPFTHTGDDHTWVLPLKDCFAAHIEFYLPEKTVQSKPWADMVVNTTAEGDHTRVNITVIPRTASVSVAPSISGKIIDFSYPPEFEVDMFFPDHFIDFDGYWEDMNQGQSYNFSILVDEPKNVGLWLDKTHGSGTEYSDRSTVSVSELGSVMVGYEVPVKWNLDTTYPEYAQGITITLDEGTTPHKQATSTATTMSPPQTPRSRLGSQPPAHTTTQPTSVAMGVSPHSTRS